MFMEIHGITKYRIFQDYAKFFSSLIHHRAFQKGLKLMDCKEMAHLLGCMVWITDSTSIQF